MASNQTYLELEDLDDRYEIEDARREGDTAIVTIYRRGKEEFVVIRGLGKYLDREILMMNSWRLAHNLKYTVHNHGFTSANFELYRPNAE